MSSGFVSPGQLTEDWRPEKYLQPRRDHALHDYGPFRRGLEYTVLRHGFDWALARVKGQRIFTPWWVFRRARELGL